MIRWMTVLSRPGVFSQPSAAGEQKGGGTMLQRRGLSLVLVMAVLLTLPATAWATLVLNYEGSLKVPTRNASPKEYYARGAAFWAAGR